MSSRQCERRARRAERPRGAQSPRRNDWRVGWPISAAAAVLALCAVAAYPLHALSAPGYAPAQASGQSGPALHKRTAAQPDGAPEPVTATGHSNLPPEAEGAYPLSESGDKLGNAIELYFDGGRLQGYMTEHLDPDPHAAPVTFDFAKTHVDGHLVEFATQVVHGTSYSFSGHLERGVAASASLPGYYRLTGTLTQHGGDADGLKRTISLKREPGTP